MNNDSISIRVSICKGAPNSFNNATTATGSVVARIEPIVKAAYHDTSSLYRSLNTTPKIPTFIHTPGPTRSKT